MVNIYNLEFYDKKLKKSIYKNIEINTHLIDNFYIDIYNDEWYIYSIRR